MILGIDDTLAALAVLGIASWCIFLWLLGAPK